MQQRRLHPLLRIADGVPVRPAKRKRTVTPAHLVPCPGRAWIGAAAVFGEQARQTGTRVIVWGHGYAERWVLLTDLAPQQVQQVWAAHVDCVGLSGTERGGMAMAAHAAH